ncbi:hypothetical protein [Victivallis vadensis]|uniref:hypothetical protein n=1 Tax=Victivallis vadensis TaxID=172901 RepID=UPI0023F9288B|nr:hypothetical protein [Victivallis vadensis]
MYNPIKNGFTIRCYGQFGISENCESCVVSTYCREAKKGLRVEAVFCGAGEYADQQPAPEPSETVDQDQEPQYSQEALLKLVNFFMELTPCNFMILKLKLLHPEMTNLDIARLMRMNSDKPIYRFFTEICEKYPELQTVLYSRKAAIK